MESKKTSDANIKELADQIINDLLEQAGGKVTTKPEKAEEVKVIAKYLQKNHDMSKSALINSAIAKCVTRAAIKLGIIVDAHNLVPQIKAEIDKRFARSGQTLVKDKLMDEILALAADKSTLHPAAKQHLRVLCIKLADKSLDFDNPTDKQLYETTLGNLATKFNVTNPQPIRLIIDSLQKQLFPSTIAKSSCAHANHVQNIPPQVLEFIDVIHVYFINFQNNSFVPPHNMYPHFAKVFLALKEPTDRAIFTDEMRSWRLILDNLAQKHSPKMRTFVKNQKPEGIARAFKLLRDKFQGTDEGKEVVPTLTNEERERELTAEEEAAAERLRAERLKAEEIAAEELVRGMLKQAQGFPEANKEVKADFATVTKHILERKPDTPEVLAASIRLHNQVTPGNKMNPLDHTAAKKMIDSLKERFAVLPTDNLRQGGTDVLASIIARELLKMSAGVSTLPQNIQHDGHTVIKYLQQDPSTHHNVEFDPIKRFISKIASERGIRISDLENPQQFKDVLDKTRKILLPKKDEEQIITDKEPAKIIGLQLRKKRLSTPDLNQKPSEPVHTKRGPAEDIALYNRKRLQKKILDASGRDSREYNIALGVRRARRAQMLAKIARHRKMIGRGYFGSYKQKMRHAIRSHQIYKKHLAHLSKKEMPMGYNSYFNTQPGVMSTGLPKQH